jgi:hypothetical protein
MPSSCSIQPKDAAPRRAIRFAEQEFRRVPAVERGEETLDELLDRARLLIHPPEIAVLVGRDRLQRAREAGQVAVSRELTLRAVLGAATLGLVWQAPVAGMDLLVTFRALIEHAAAGKASPAAAVRVAAMSGLRAAAPMLALVLVAGGRGGCRARPDRVPAQPGLAPS